MLPRVIPLLAFLALAPACLGAQAPTPDTARVRLTAILRADLRNYIASQERVYGARNTYAQVLQAADHRSPPGVTIIVLTSSGTGHSAIAVHRDMPGLVCAIWVGQKAVPPLHDGAQEGDPTCRAP
jgi:hypothetical protein